MAEPIDSGIVNSGEKTNLDHQISKEIDSGKHSRGRRTVGQGYSGHGLNHEHLGGATAVRWAAPDPTSLNDIARRLESKVNA